MTYVAHDESAFVRPAEVEEAELYHPKTFIGKYIWSQDAKVIAVQYALTAIGVGLIALVLSGIMVYVILVPPLVLMVLMAIGAFEATYTYFTRETFFGPPPQTAQVIHPAPAVRR